LSGRSAAKTDEGPTVLSACLPADSSAILSRRSLGEDGSLAAAEALTPAVEFANEPVIGFVDVFRDWPGGLEPLNSVFSSLLIIAFLDTCLQKVILDCPNEFKRLCESAGK